MHSPKLLLALVALLTLAARPAFADGGPMSQPYRRPAQLLQPVEPTTQAHLDAAQRALKLALDLLLTQPSPNSPTSNNRGGGASNRDLAISYGGYFARAREDLTKALDATAESIAFVRAHPEINPLAAGPARAEEPKSPLLPSLRSTLVTRGNTTPRRETALDAVNAALEVLVNNSARDYHGPILGDIGGHRAKVIAAIAQVGMDFSNAISYYQNMRGGSSSIIPLSAPANLPADPKYGPTARMYLEEARTLLDNVGSSLAVSLYAFTGDQTQGGNVAKVDEDVQRAAKELTAALAYLDAHPEADVLKAGPAGAEPSAVRRATVPPMPRYTVPASATASATTVAARRAADATASAAARASVTPKLTATTVQNLNSALGWLLNNPAPDYHGRILGDLGGYRGKILDDLGQALADTLAGIEFTATKDPAVNAPLPLGAFLDSTLHPPQPASP